MLIVFNRKPHAKPGFTSCKRKPARTCEQVRTVQHPTTRPSRRSEQWATVILREPPPSNVAVFGSGFEDLSTARGLGSATRSGRRGPVRTLRLSYAPHDRLLQTLSEAARILEFTLPNDENVPSAVPEGVNIAPVAGDVGLELPRPEFDPRLRYCGSRTTRMTMPEAAV